MPNDQMQTVLEAFAGLGAISPESQTPANARNLPTMADAAHAVVGHSVMKRSMAAMPMPVGAVKHETIEGPGGPILVRIYSPEGSGPFPVMVYFHGGGWVIATLDTYDDSCRALTKEAGCIVISVAYRQAPEHKYPAAAEDAFAAYMWALQNAARIGGDPERVAVGGESAGGNLAAVVSLMARDQGVPLPKHQLLVYPVIDSAMDSPSYREQATAKPLSAAAMRWFWGHYLASPADGGQPYASPIRAGDLSGLPSATVITDEFDPLRSEGEAYARALQSSGVPVSYRHYDGVAHEFFGMKGVVKEAGDAIEVAGKDLNAAFANQFQVDSRY